MSRTCPRQRALERLRAKEIDLKTYNRIMAALDRADVRNTIRRDFARAIAEMQ